MKTSSPSLIEYDVDKIALGRLVALYLIHSYIYYELGASVISDQTYDAIALRLKKQWMFVKHPHKHLIDRKALTTSGFYLTYPNITQLSGNKVYLDWVANK